MTIPLRSLRRDTRGVGLVEFALMVPLLVVILVGIAQMGSLYFAHSGLRSLVADGARFASISPRPTADAVRARLRAGGFGLTTASIAEPSVTLGNTNGTSGNWYYLISVTYTLQLDYVFWRPAPTTLTETRTVYIYPMA